MNRNKYFDIELYFQKISISEVHGQKHREQFFKLSNLYYWIYSSGSNSIKKLKGFQWPQNNCFLKKAES